MPVPLGRRLLFAQPARLLAASAAVGMAFMLILLFDGLWAGVRAQVTAYEDGSAARLFVLAPGTETLFAEGGTMPRSVVDAVRDTPGVAWAAPVRSTFSVLAVHQRRVAASVVGFEPGRRGGPAGIDEGRDITGPGQAVVDPSLARRHGLRPGASLTIQNRDFDVVGVASPPGAFMTGLVYVSHADLDALLGSPELTSAVLVGTSDPVGVRDRLAAAGLHVVDRDQLRRADTAFATRVYGVPLRLMVGAAVVAGILLIGFVGYTGVVEHQRQYGLVKALGARHGVVLRLALGHTAAVTALGLVSGMVLLYATRAVLAAARPQFVVVVAPGTFLRTAVIAMAMAAVAALLPVERVLRLDPAAAFRGA